MKRLSPRDSRNPQSSVKPSPRQRREEEHATAILKTVVCRARMLPGKIVSDGEYSFERAYWKFLGLKHRRVKMVHGVPMACGKHGLDYNNNPAEQMVDELKDWYRHMNGFDSDESASGLLRGWTVHVDLVNNHSRERT